MWTEYVRKKPEKCPKSADWCAWNETVTPLVDTYHSEAVVGFLTKAVARQPFMVAFGINKPHSPIAYPDRFDTLYPRASRIPLPHPTVRAHPKNSPAIAYAACKAVHLPKAVRRKWLCDWGDMDVREVKGRGWGYEGSEG